MNRITNLVLVTSLLTGAATAQQSTEPADLDSSPFSFEDAWNARQENGAAMAMIPDPDCEAASSSGVCDEYRIGVSISGGGEVTPVFNAYGHLEETEIWVLPESKSYYQFDLATVFDQDGRLGVAGGMHVVGSMIAGWLTTPNGYSEYVTGYLWSVVTDFEAPEAVQVGSMIFTPIREWRTPDLGYAYMAYMADSLWSGQSLGSAYPIDTEQVDIDVNPTIKCLVKHLTDVLRCEEYKQANLDQAEANHEACLNAIGFLDVLIGAGAGGAAAGTLGASMGSGSGTVVVPGIGTVAGGVFGGIVGGIVGGIGGAFAGPALAEEACDVDLAKANNKAEADYQKCLADARAAYRVCLIKNR